MATSSQFTTSGWKVVHEFSLYEIKFVNSGECYPFFEKNELDLQRPPWLIQLLKVQLL